METEYERDDRLRSTAYEALSLCQRCSPTGKVQAGFAHLYNTMLMAGEEYTAVIKTMVDRLCDGLTNGNWPEA